MARITELTSVKQHLKISNVPIVAKTTRLTLEVASSTPQIRTKTRKNPSKLLKLSPQLQRLGLTLGNSEQKLKVPRSVPRYPRPSQRPIKNEHPKPRLLIRPRQDPPLELPPSPALARPVLLLPPYVLHQRSSAATTHRRSANSLKQFKKL